MEYYSRNTSDWDTDALRELAETGRVADALETHTKADDAKSQKQISDSINSGGRRFTVYRLQDGTWQSLSSLEAAVEAAQKNEKAADGGGIWLDVTDPNTEDMERLARTFGMHPLTVEDILADAGDRDKLEAVDDYALLVYRTTADAEGDMGFSVVLRKDAVLSFHSTGTLHHVRNAAERLGGGRQSTRQDVVYGLVDDITDSLGETMRLVEQEVAAIDAAVMVGKGAKGETLRQIGQLRRRILQLWRLVLGKPDVVRALGRLLAAGGEGGDMVHYVEDIGDHLAALTSACAHSEMVLSRAHANYMARLSLDLSEASVDAGLFSNRWLVLVGILFPLQVAISYFGQNVKVPWKIYADAGINTNLHAWFGIFGVAAGVFVLAVGLARLKQML
ncbi:hypothetical protein EV175_000315 [Coemansia sp. RSA 1933]|nr:hypothetical protein EV175_000315 [Coemansia sp. RSA 1933]